MAVAGRPVGEEGLSALMAASPEPRAHMSVAAESTLLLGLGALLAAPFSAFFAVGLVFGVTAVCCGVVGMITTRGPDVAGSALSAVGLFCGLAALALVGLRYLGLDTAFGDDLGPWLLDLLDRWSSRLPQPR
jgi:uncharacterized membrane protein HdeD (DUF308 family)